MELEKENLDPLFCRSLGVKLVQTESYLENKKTFVIGGNIEALLYSFFHNLPLLYCRTLLPGCLDAPILFENRSIDAQELWSNLYFWLALHGKILFSDKINNIRLEDDNILNIFTKRARSYSLKFEHLIIFDDDSLTGISASLLKKQREIYEVRDWFNVRSGMKHNFTTIETDSNFVKSIYFYPSERMDGNHNFKDAVAISYLTDEMLNSFECSDVNARFKTLSHMKERGIKGARNGRDTLHPDKYKYYAVKIEHARREIITPMKYYDSNSTYTFKYDSVGDIMTTEGIKCCAARKFRNYITR